PAYGRSLPSPSARCARKRHFGIVVVPSPFLAAEFPGQRFYCPRRGAGRPVLYRRGPARAAPRTDQAQTFGTRARQFQPLLQTLPATCEVTWLIQLTRTRGRSLAPVAPRSADLGRLQSYAP